jgi:hypothetical protein
MICLFVEKEQVAQLKVVDFFMFIQKSDVMYQNVYMQDMKHYDNE